MNSTKAALKLISIKYAPWFALAAIVLGLVMGTITATSYVYQTKISRIENNHRNAFNKQRREIVKGLDEIKSKLDVVQDQISSNPIRAKQSVQEAKREIDEVKP